MDRRMGEFSGDTEHDQGLLLPCFLSTAVSPSVCHYWDSECELGAVSKKEAQAGR